MREYNTPDEPISGILGVPSLTVRASELLLEDLSTSRPQASDEDPVVLAYSCSETKSHIDNARR
jgi:hypothetical protein